MRASAPAPPFEARPLHGVRHRYTGAIPRARRRAAIWPPRTQVLPFCNVDSFMARMPISPRRNGRHWRKVACIPCYRGTMITSFRDRGTQDVFNGKRTRAARRVCPQSVWRVAAKRLDQLDSATELRDLRAPPGNRLEALSGDRAGQHSIRINDQYRVCFLWTDAGAEQVEIVDYH